MRLSSLEGYAFPEAIPLEIHATGRNSRGLNASVATTQHAVTVKPVAHSNTP
jgi:hypothetical protein